MLNIMKLSGRTGVQDEKSLISKHVFSYKHHLTCYMYLPTHFMDI